MLTKRLPKKVKLLVLLGLILLLSGGIFLLVKSNHKEEMPQIVLTCREVVSSASELALKQKLAEASNLLTSNELRCTQAKDTSAEAKVDLFSYYVAIANVAYNNNDKAKAYDYAKKAVKEHDAIPATTKKSFDGMSQNEVMLLNILESQQAEQATKGQAQ